MLTGYRAGNRTDGARARRSASAAAALSCVLGLLLAACTVDGASIEPRGMACVDDSQQCIGERATARSQLLSDKQRNWVKQPASAAAYASGVRMLAYKQMKREMSCDELATGRREADAAPGTLRGPQGQGLTPAQISRGVMLAAEISRELDNEMKRRCRA